MLSETVSDPQVLNTIGRPVVWSIDSQLQDEFTEVCASVADRHERSGCRLEKRGLRCWACRPFILAVKTPVARHYATFLRRPEGAQ